MKTLYIVRHAKSSWDYSGVADTDRPLKEKGIKLQRDTNWKAYFIYWDTMSNAKVKR
jgi:phosphohistidine phosphatase SixA